MKDATFLQQIKERGMNTPLDVICTFDALTKEVETARKSSAYWKAEHLAGNAEVDRLGETNAKYALIAEKAEADSKMLRGALEFYAKNEPVELYLTAEIDEVQRIAKQAINDIDTGKGGT